MLAQYFFTRCWSRHFDGLLCQSSLLIVMVIPRVNVVTINNGISHAQNTVLQSVFNNIGKGGNLTQACKFGQTTPACPCTCLMAYFIDTVSFSVTCRPRSGGFVARKGPAHAQLSNFKNRGASPLSFTAAYILLWWRSMLCVHQQNGQPRTSRNFLQ